MSVYTQVGDNRRGLRRLSQTPYLLSCGDICFCCFVSQNVLLHCPQKADSPFLSGHFLGEACPGLDMRVCRFIAHITIAI